MSAAQTIVRRSHVSLAGRVVAANGAPAQGARLMLIRTTVTDDKHVLEPREDIGRCSNVRPDGMYFFLDLPLGNYCLYSFDDRGRPILQHSVAIAPGTEPGRFPMLDVDLRVAPNRPKPDAEPPRRTHTPAQRRSSRSTARGD